MRHNGRPRILASTLAPTRIDLEARAVVCPRCDTWRGLTRSIIRVHSRPTGGGRDQGAHCPGSGQRITMDLTVDEWRRRLAGDRRRVRASRMAPTRIDPEAGAVVCSVCGTWRRLTGGVVRVHGGTGDRPVCSGSGRPITMDVSVDEWRRRLVDGARGAGSRSATRVSRKPSPPAPPALGRLREPAPAGRGSARTRAEQWAAVVPAVELVNSARRIQHLI